MVYAVYLRLSLSFNQGSAISAEQQICNAFRPHRHSSRSSGQRWSMFALHKEC
jgi:hypothetical protein